MVGTKAQRYAGTPRAGQILVITHTINDSSATSDYDQAIALPFNVVILNCYVTVETTLAADGTNYNTLAISDGTNDILSADSKSSAFTADTPRALGNYDPAHNLIAAGDPIHFTKTHSGTPANAMGQIDFVLVVQTI